jgi:hypothetical protein
MCSHNFRRTKVKVTKMNPLLSVETLEKPTLKDPFWPSRSNCESLRSCTRRCIDGLSVPKIKELMSQYRFEIDKNTYKCNVYQHLNIFTDCRSFRRYRTFLDNLSWIINITTINETLSLYLKT